MTTEFEMMKNDPDLEVERRPRRTLVLVLDFKKGPPFLGEPFELHRMLALSYTYSAMYSISSLSPSRYRSGKALL